MIKLVICILPSFISWNFANIDVSRTRALRTNQSSFFNTQRLKYVTLGYENIAFKRNFNIPTKIHFKEPQVENNNEKLSVALKYQDFS